MQRYEVIVTIKVLHIGYLALFLWYISMRHAFEHTVLIVHNKSINFVHAICGQSFLIPSLSESSRKHAYIILTLLNPTFI